MARIFSKKGCLIGCGGALAIGLIITSVTLFTINRTYNHAADSRQSLTETHGERGDYDPGAGPALAAERLDAFLTVRRSLTASFENLGGANEAMRGMERFDGRDEVSKGELFSQFLASTVGAFSQIVHLGGFALDRNRALLDNGMGIGEYAWIYSLVYYGCLGEQPILGMGEDSPGAIPSTVRCDLVEMMRRRADALGALAGADASVEAQLWRREATRLADDEYAVPFAGSAPASVTACIEAHRDQLAALFCRDSDALELMRIKEFGMGYEDR